MQASHRVLCLTAFLQTTILTAGLITFRSNYLLGVGLMLSAKEVERIAGGFWNGHQYESQFVWSDVCRLQCSQCYETNCRCCEIVGGEHTRYQKFGIEIEMTGLSREKAAQLPLGILGRRRGMWEGAMILIRLLTGRAAHGNLYGIPASVANQELEA